MKYKFRVFDINAGKYMKPSMQGKVPVFEADSGAITLDLAIIGKGIFIPEMKVYGKEDSSGKDIYEGDIVEVEKYGNFPGIFYTIKWVYSSEGYYLGLVDREGFPMGRWPSKPDMTVIGNINENKDLLDE